MIEADLSGIGSYIGAVQGTLDAVASPGFEDAVISTIMQDVKKQFMIDAVASREVIKHMFEWGSQDSSGVANGDVGMRPLFALTKAGKGGSQYMSFRFLPSTVPVPLPDPAATGFNPDKLEHLSRHVFHMKAVVMETQSSVTIAPQWSERGLFIPSADSKYGYIMTKKSVAINPGGAGSTGAFAAYWTTWFSGVAPQIVEATARMVEDDIVATGQKVVRYKAGTVIDGKKVGGQFAAAQHVSVGYVNAQARSAEQYAKNLLNKKYSSGRLWEDDDE